MHKETPDARVQNGGLKLRRRATGGWGGWHTLRGEEGGQEPHEVLAAAQAEGDGVLRLRRGQPPQQRLVAVPVCGAPPRHAFGVIHTEVGPKELFGVPGSRQVGGGVAPSGRGGRVGGHPQNATLAPARNERLNPPLDLALQRTKCLWLRVSLQDRGQVGAGTADRERFRPIARLARGVDREKIVSDKMGGG